MGKQSDFRLPSEITTKQTFSAEGYHIQTFIHCNLGKIGRIIILPHGSDTQICCEVIGDPDDPMTEKKRDIFSPIAEQILKILNGPFGKGVNCVIPYSIREGGDIVESTVYPCDVCGNIVAMTINAYDAQTQGDLEDYASKMYSRTRELNVPTWIIGREKEITLNGSKTGEAILMKIWPNRKDPTVAEAGLFNKGLDQLMYAHCKVEKERKHNGKIKNLII